MLQVVLGGNMSYLSDCLECVALPASAYVDLAGMHSREVQRRDKAENFQALLETCRDVTVAHQLATEVRSAPGRRFSMPRK